VVSKNNQRGAVNHSILGKFSGEGSQAYAYKTVSNKEIVYTGQGQSPMKDPVSSRRRDGEGEISGTILCGTGLSGCLG